MLGLISATALLAGLLTGLVGVGGVVLVPILTELAGIPLAKAVPATVAGLLLGAIYAAIVHIRRTKLPLRSVAIFIAAGACGALGGAATFSFWPATVIKLFVAVLCVVSGVNSLIPKPVTQERTLAPPLLGVLGIFVGYSSAITGTGGPVILIPILLALRVPANIAVTLGLAIQVPITLFATGVYAMRGQVDASLAAIVALMILIGIVIGSNLSGRVSVHALKFAVAWALIVVGAWYLYGSAF